ncbi:MAG TPA: EAL domain-containing protein [Acidimicrobiales bacterium]|nr:EAL domain-containing protein [Acidimicrobiales bacterium]
MAVVAVAGWSVLGLTSTAEEHHKAALRAARLQAVAEAIDADEWRARAVGTVTPEIEMKMTSDLARADDLLAQVSTRSRWYENAAAPFREYRDGVTEEFKLLRQGDLGAAIKVDEERVDPAFDQLHDVLKETSNQATRSAERAVWWLRVGSLLAMMSAGGLITFIVLRANRHRLHAVASHERATVMAESELRFRALVQNAADGIMVTGPDNRVTFASPSAAALVGLNENDLVGRRLGSLGVSSARGAASVVDDARTANDLEHAEWRSTDTHGRRRTIEAIANPSYAGGPEGAVLVTLRDVTEHKLLEQLLIHRASHDALTGLVNRDEFVQYVERTCLNPDTRAALVFIDLDDFKNVNDTLGHNVGDDLLRAVSHRLRTALRPRDVPARLGGDEFAVLLDDVSGPEGALDAAQRILAAFERPFVLHGFHLMVTTSVGVAVVGPGDEPHSVHELLRAADIAMYQAKGAGKGRIELFVPVMQERLQQRVALRNDLIQAVRQGDLDVHYQPIVSIHNREIVGFEALARWNHPTAGAIPPARFIPVAEESGLIAEIGRFVLTDACRQAAAWRLTLRRDYAVSVNVSVRQFDGDLVGEVRAALETSGLPAHLLTLEITESALRGRDKAITQLTALKALGVRVALDDFGTGYSALSYVRDFPLDEIKIDRSFVDAIDDEAGLQLVKAIIDLARALGITTVAEGIERPHQLRVLQAHGCTLGQGFLFAPAMPKNEVVAAVANRMADQALATSDAQA